MHPFHKTIHISTCSNTCHTALLIAAVICVTFIACHGCHEVESTNRQAIKSGLQQKQLEGTTTTAWQKP